jgi:hypothetical protein
MKNATSNAPIASFLGSIAVMKATTISYGHLFSYCNEESNNICSCRLLLFGSITMKKVTTTSYHRLLLFGFVVVKKVTVTSCRHLFFWFCYNEEGNGSCCNKKGNDNYCKEEGDNTKLSLPFPFFLLQQKRRRQLLASPSSFFLLQQKRR